METTYRYKPVPYFVAAFAATWIPWAYAIWLASADPKATYGSAVNFLGLFAPLIVALVFIYRSGHVPLRRDFHRRLWDFGLMNWPLLLATAIVVPAIAYAAIWLSLPMGESRDQFKIIDGAWKWLPIILLAPTIEELAWRGYAMDSLRARWGMLRSSLLFGVLWALWHTPLFFMKGTYHYDLTQQGALYVVNFFVSVVAVAVVASWLYYRHRRFIIAGILFHFLINASAILLSATQPTKCIVTALYIVLAGAIVIYDRRLFGEGPKSFVEEAT